MAGRVCPVWIGYFLASPIRRFFHNPKKILGDYIKPGMSVLDIGCAMGYFSLAMARMVGANGQVISVDLQAKMINSLNRRASKAGLADRIKSRVCTTNSLEINDLANQIDFALAFHVVHEVPDVDGFMAQVYSVVKPVEKFFIVEPLGHTTAKEYEATEAAAQEAGFKIVDRPKFKSDRATLFVKP